MCVCLAGERWLCLLVVAALPLQAWGEPPAQPQPRCACLLHVPPTDLKIGSWPETGHIKEKKSDLQTDIKELYSYQERGESLKMHLQGVTVLKELQRHLSNLVIMSDIQILVPLRLFVPKCGCLVSRSLVLFPLRSRKDLMQFQILSDSTCLADGVTCVVTLEKKIHMQNLFAAIVDSNYTNIFAAYWVPVLAADISAQITTDIDSRTSSHRMKRRLVTPFGSEPGTQWRVVSIHDPYFTVLEELNGVVVRVGGSIGEVWTTLETTLNITSVYAVPRDGAFGALDRRRGAWSGLVGLVVRGAADVALAALGMDRQRAAAVRFAMPVFTTRINVYIKTPPRQTFGSGHSRLLCYLGAAVLADIAAFTIALTLITWRTRPPLSHIHLLLQNLTYIIAIFLRQGDPQRGVCWAQRVVVVCAQLVGLLVLTASCGLLVSFLADSRSLMPFSDLDGMLRDGSYKLHLVPRGIEHSIFSEARSEKLRLVYGRLVQPHEASAPVSSAVSLRRACADSHAAVALLQELAALANCSLSPLPAEFFPTNLAFAVARGNRHLDRINSVLLLLQNGGILNRLKKSEWPPKYEQDEESVYYLGIEQSMLMVSVVYVGIAVSLGILLLEKQLAKYYKRNCISDSQTLTV